MSTVNVQASTSARDAITYALVGKGKQREQHQKDGTTRAAALSSSVSSTEDFIARAEQLAHAHHRRNELYTYTQNFSPDEFDLNNPDHVRRVNMLGVLLAKRMNSADYLVVTHVDSAGGHLHNHIYVINHDQLTGKALKRCTSWIHGLHQVNDELMRDEGCEVLPSPEAPKPDWDLRRQAFKPGGFEQTLGDKVADALMDPRSVDRDGFEEALAERGVTLAETERDGWAYKMRRTDNNKLGRKKASGLCDEFTASGVQPVFDYHRANAERINHERTEELAGAAVEFADVESLDAEARRHRAAVEQADHGSERAGAVREGDGRSPDGQADRVDLAAARAALEAAARRRDEEQDHRDREDARRRRIAAEQQRSREAARRVVSAPVGLGCARDDDGDREAARDDSPEFG